jgi:sterol desaturase/sphingolipid hydroxylase (fatty acid hydroxylase superfamily)
MLEGSWTPIALAVPVFFALIGIELWIAHRLGRSVYRLGDAVSDLGCGILQQVFGILLRGGLFGVYVYLYANHRWLDLPSAAWTWALCFIGVDFLYYWFHRISHGVNFMWAAHVVHHQSEDYNLAVALRQGAFQGFFSWVFYLPLAIVGFEPVMFAICNSLNTLYQFWVHTRLVGRLGPLEYVLNTPSHHRVHHGRDPEYIDKNHAGALIVWDRLFGTFQPEREEPTYGITERLEFFDPVWAQLHPWRSLWLRAKRYPRWSDRLKLWFMPPAWEPRDAPAHATRPLDDPKYDRPAAGALGWHVLTQFAPLVPATMLFIYWRKTAPPELQWGAAFFMAATLVALSGLVDGRPWARGVESARLISLPLLAMAAARIVGFDPIVAGVAGLAWAAPGLWWIRAAGSATVAAPARSET